VHLNPNLTFPLKLIITIIALAVITIRGQLFFAAFGDAIDFWGKKRTKRVETIQGWGDSIAHPHS
jgi:hypothetical protein